MRKPARNKHSAFNDLNCCEHYRYFDRLSEFIKRLQSRLKAEKMGKSLEATDLKGNESSRSNSDNALNKGFLNLFWLKLTNLSIVPPNSKPEKSLIGRLIQPSSISQQLSILLALACALTFVFWSMKIAQIPGLPNAPVSGINKGSAVFSNQDGTTAYGLFGNKPLATENIYLRGVAVTSRGKDGSVDGFAIFEIDGKPTNAISVGENLGKGLLPQSIGDESATLLYQGEKLDFKLSKPGKDKSSSSSKK